MSFHRLSCRLLSDSGSRPDRRCIPIPPLHEPKGHTRIPVLAGRCRSILSTRQSTAIVFSYFGSSLYYLSSTFAPSFASKPFCIIISPPASIRNVPPRSTVPPEIVTFPLHSIINVAPFSMITPSSIHTSPPDSNVRVPDFKTTSPYLGLFQTGKTGNLIRFLTEFPR